MSSLAANVANAVQSPAIALSTNTQKAIAFLGSHKREVAVIAGSTALIGLAFVPGVPLAATVAMIAIGSLSIATAATAIAYQSGEETETLQMTSTEKMYYVDKEGVLHDSLSQNPDQEKMDSDSEGMPPKLIPLSPGQQIGVEESASEDDAQSTTSETPPDMIEVRRDQSPDVQPAGSPWLRTATMVVMVATIAYTATYAALNRFEPEFSE